MSRLLEYGFSARTDMPTIWKTERVAGDESLIPLMEANGVVYKAIPESNNYVLGFLFRIVFPIVLMIFLFRFVSKRMGGLGAPM